MEKLLGKKILSIRLKNVQMQIFICHFLDCLLLYRYNSSSFNVNLIY
ncbi:hypothetical protein HNR69_000854 [Histophilus somni]|nr:hypothetical protein [Histophilus somni]